jgi:hypothetical protein
MKVEVYRGKVLITCVSLGDGEYRNVNESEEDVELIMLDVKRFDHSTWITVPGASFHLIIPKDAKKRKVQDALEKLMGCIREPITEWYDERNHHWLKDPAEKCAQHITAIFDEKDTRGAFKCQ